MHARLQKQDVEIQQLLIGIAARLRAIADHQFQRNSAAQAIFLTNNSNNLLPVRTGRAGPGRDKRASGRRVLAPILRPWHMQAATARPFCARNLLVSATGPFCDGTGFGRYVDRGAREGRGPTSRLYVYDEGRSTNSTTSRFHFAVCSGRGSIDRVRARRFSAPLEDVRPVCFILGSHLNFPKSVNV